MKLNKLFASAMCVATLAMIACQKQTPTVIPPTGGEEEEEVIPPVVAAPGTGKTTLVVYVPKNTSDKGLYAIGTITGWDNHNKEGFRFSKVEGDETGRWYQLTMDYAADMMVKVCAIPANSAPGWSFQWAKNMAPGNDLTEDNVILLSGQLTFDNSENGGEPKAINFADNGVAYVQIKAWAADPTVSIPAGKGTFTVTISNLEYKDGDKCIFTGNFAEKAWGESDREMTYKAEDNTWSWTGDYPENFQYKVIYNGNWADGGNVIFDGKTYSATFKIQVPTPAE